jgi:glycosyltransferase involved in cell wall biosynthesis
MKKLAIISSHPIQYNAPWFKLLAQSSSIRPLVFYTWGEAGAAAKYDHDFGRKIEWDIPLLEGYEYRFVKNTSADPGTHHFKGIVNPDLIAELEAWKPDALLVIGWSFHSHLRCLRHFHGRVPVLFRGDSTLLNEQPGIKKLLRRIFLKWVYRHVDKALYVGRNNRDYYLAHGMKEHQLIFAPHAIDNRRFGLDGARYDAEAEEWKSRLGIKEDQLVLLFAGKLEPRKNPFFLTRLAAGIGDPRLRFLIVGNGVLEQQLKAAAAGDPRWIFLDFQNQLKMPVIYRMGHIFVLPSVSETWGLAINETMACGRAVMVSKMAGCAVDLVQDGDNGQTIDPDDLSESIRFLEKAIGDRALVTRMGGASLKIIQSFSFENIVLALENTV